MENSIIIKMATCLFVSRILSFDNVVAGVIEQIKKIENRNWLMIAYFLWRLFACQ